MHFCLGLASHATVIDEGRIVYTSCIDELKANDNIKRRDQALQALRERGRTHGGRTQADADA